MKDSRVIGKCCYEPHRTAYTELPSMARSTSNFARLITLFIPPTLPILVKIGCEGSFGHWFEIYHFYLLPPPLCISFCIPVNTCHTHQFILDPSTHCQQEACGKILRKCGVVYKIFGVGHFVTAAVEAAAAVTDDSNSLKMETY
jgi:hypothetical protein